jgi:type I restriction enzyme R subunit
VQIYEPGENDSITPPDDIPPPDSDPVPTQPGEDEVVVDAPPDISIDPGATPQTKIYVDGVSVTVIAERVQYLDEDGKLITESLRDFTKNALKKRFVSLDRFLTQWKAADRKQAIVEELEQEGLSLEPLVDEVGKELDPFDLICHVAFDQPPLTRKERAEKVRKQNIFTKYGPQARAVLEALLQKYQDQGAMNLDDPRVLQIPPFDTMGTPIQLIKQFGTRADFERAVHELQAALYQQAA